MLKKTFIYLIIAILSLIPQYAALAGKESAEPSEWYVQPLRRAIYQGWLDAFPDGLRPDQLLTRAEFVQALAKADRLIPESQTVAFLKTANPNAAANPFNDMQEHWLAKSGLLTGALSFGLVDPSDYSGLMFRPDSPISRYESAIMTVRAMGMVYQASGKTGNARFSDAGSFPVWAKGYVLQLGEVGICSGYGDGSFKGERAITRAEAAVMLCNMVDSMTRGIDPEIKLIVNRSDVRYPSLVTTVEPSLPVPAIRQDSRIFVPVRSLFGDLNYGWNPKDQTLSFEFGVSHDFQAGNARYGFLTGIHQYSGQMPAAAKVLYGEIMVPAYDPSSPVPTNIWSQPVWDEAKKTLNINVINPGHPIS